MERLQKTILLIGLPFIVFLTIRLTHRADWLELGMGLIGKGDGWWFFPPGIAIASFLGAFAYSGAGGNLNLAQSYYVKEKGLGMGKYSGKITSLFTPGKKEVKLEGERFSDTVENRKSWLKWWKLVTREHLVVFYSLGLLTILILAVLSKSLTYHLSSESGLSFLYQEGAQVGIALSPGFGTAFLLIAGLMLYSTQLGVLESSSRIISENVLLLRYKQGMKANPSLAFFVALWGQIVLGILTLLAGIQEPRLLLTLGAVLNAVAMMTAFPLVYLVNKRFLPAKYHPTTKRKIMLLLAFIFFLIFVIFTFSNLSI